VDLAKLWGQGLDASKFGGHMLSDYMSLNEDGSLNTYNAETGLSLQDLLNISDDKTDKAIEDFVSNYNSKWQDQQKSLSGMREQIDEIEA
jgi:hypothetical protein